MADDAAERAESAEARAQEFERAFRNLVARIDGDGGHAQDGTSVEESLARADAAVVALQARAKELEARTWCGAMRDQPCTCAPTRERFYRDGRVVEEQK